MVTKRRYASSFGLVALLFCSAATPAVAQGIYGVQAGVGMTPGYDGRKTVAMEAYYLHKMAYHLYAGGSLFYQRYSIENPISTKGTASYGDVIAIRQKSSYVFVSPKVDWAINYRSYFHLFATAGVGIRMGGRQWTDTHQPLWTTPLGGPYGADTVAVNTTYNLPGVITRFGFGIAERIPTSRFFSILLSQEVGFMSGLSKGPYPIQAPYFAFQIGITHKYPQVFVEY
jgi:hypothetical protein